MYDGRTDRVQKKRSTFGRQSNNNVQLVGLENEDSNEILGSSNMEGE